MSSHIFEHGRTWPLIERQKYVVSATASIDDENEAEQRAATLRLAGFEVAVKQVARFELSPEDQSEKDALEASITGGAK